MGRRVLAVMSTALLFAGYATAQQSSKTLTGKPLIEYSVLVVERFKVDPEALKAGFAEAQAPVMQAEIVLELVKKKIFDQVVDGSSLPPTQADAQSPAENGKAKLILCGTVTSFEPGNQAERYLVGFGAELRS